MQGSASHRRLATATLFGWNDPMARLLEILMRIDRALHFGHPGILPVLGGVTLSEGTLSEHDRH